MDEDALRKEFDRLDLDQSGSIDQAELTTVLKALGEDHSDERVSKAIQEVDKDANGKIEFQEFVRFVELVRSGDKAAANSDFANIQSSAAARAAILEKIKENTPEKIKKEKVWRPGQTKDGFGAKPSSQVKMQREPPKGAPPPKKDLSQLP
eukprot:m.195961 g.195961  ORF g.195961 m.195961 type:complete len:151 (-) comp21824_c0_seq1:255-707(-)